MIDLHLHTTASDGRLAPPDLVERVAAAGITVLAVTDHDTTAADAEVRVSAARLGVEAVSGIEMTAVEDGRDVHVLGYFIDPAHEVLATLLARQRLRRVVRAEALAERLAALGMPIDIEAIVTQARREPGRSIGRPQIAAAMVAAGYVRNTNEAFEAWLGRGRPAFVTREGPSVADTVAALHQAGGVASLAHPAKTGCDERIAGWRDAGLDALEAFHSDHDAVARQRYVEMARSLGMYVTGGSDYHAVPEHGVEPGTATLPRRYWEALRDGVGR